jgi:hypothetical protein
MGRTGRSLGICILLSFAASGAVPSPESYFGFKMGADKQLLDWSKVVSYFDALGHSSDRIRVRELGKTTDGRPFIAATISSPETLRNLDRYLEIQKRLADPRKTSEAEAQKFIADGKAVVMITCSIHSTEVASTESGIQFAYKLLTEDTPKTRTILDNTILILVPSLNPDGVDLVTAWYRKTLGTPFEGTSPPELYQKYVGHDNNRDWYIFSQKETRLTVSQLHNVWHPQIVYDVHQQGQYGSRLFLPPWLDPIDPNVDPILVQEMSAFGTAMAADLTAAGKTGVVTHALYDFWTPARQYSAYHAGLRILSESASARLASPVEIKPEQIEAQDLGFNPRERSWNYPEPWRGGTWKVGDIVDYQLLAMESCLYHAALGREDLLRNFFQIGQRAIATSSLFAFVIPVPQRDPGAARQLIETLRFGGVEVEQAKKEFTAGGKHYLAGSIVIPMAQPYSRFAKTLLETQHYPDLRAYTGGPPQRPYDVTAQTLPLLMGVTVEAVNQPFEASFARSLSIDPDGGDTSMPAADTDTWRKATKLLADGKPLWRDPDTGDFLRHLPDGAEMLRVRAPKIGLYRSWTPAIDEGWTRWLLDTFGFAFESVHNGDLEAAGLHSKFDVIVFPDQRAATIEEGYRAGSMPAEYTGGLSKAGAAELRRFVENGGVLIFLNRSTQYALEHLDLKLKNVLDGVPDRDFYSPGSLLNVVMDTHDPLCYGVPERIATWNEQSPAWEVPTDEKVHAVARYVSENVLASGWLLGETHIAGKAALLRIEHGKGQIILFGMSPQYRAQSYLTFKLFFNALVAGVSTLETKTKR